MHIKWGRECYPFWWVTGKAVTLKLKLELIREAATTSTLSLTQMTQVSYQKKLALFIMKLKTHLTQKLRKPKEDSEEDEAGTGLAAILHQQLTT